MNDNLRILGIDPGLARLGWAILETTGSKPVLIGCGCLETAPQQPDGPRLRELAERLRGIVAEYRPQRAAMEKLYFSKNVTTAMSVGQARGVAALIVAEAGLPLLELSPTSIKQSVTGDGRADKRQMGKMVQLLLGLEKLPRHDDTTDAIAVGLCGLSTKMLH